MILIFFNYGKISNIVTHAELIEVQGLGNYFNDHIAICNNADRHPLATNVIHDHQRAHTVLAHELRRFRNACFSCREHDFAVTG